MDRNEAPYGPPRQVVREVVDELGRLALNRYPKEDGAALQNDLAGYLEWSGDGLWVGNGSNEVFLHLLLAFGGAERTVLCFEPTYPMHSIIPRIGATKVRRLWRTEEFVIDLEDALAEVERTEPEMILLCSPNNPTGNSEPLTTIRALLEAAPGIVVVDEAYGEFAPSDESVRPLLDEHTNLVLIKTFSKAWSLAGVRIGYMLADPLLIEGLARIGLPHHLSTLTQVVGRAALRHAPATAELIEALVSERDRIVVELQAMGVKTFRSRANFVLFQVDDAPGVWSRLLRRGVLVRNCSDTPGLFGCLRVTAGLPEDGDAFLAALEEALDV
jgi:histidinol-phosphate aminotransferase